MVVNTTWKTTERNRKSSAHDDQIRLSGHSFPALEIGRAEVNKNRKVNLAKNQFLGVNDFVIYLTRQLIVELISGDKSNS